MTILFYATAVAIIIGGFVPIRRAWPDYLVAALLGADAAGLFLAHRIAPGVLCLVLAMVWLTLRMKFDRRTGGAR